MTTHLSDSTLEAALRDAHLALDAAVSDPRTLGFLVVVIAEEGDGSSVVSTGGWRPDVQRRKAMLLVASACRQSAREMGREEK